MRADQHSPPQLAPQKRFRRSGFTLVEIMAVMAVIAILLSVAAVGIQNIDRGQATTSGLAVAEALFDEARSAAVGRGTRARLLIHNQMNDNDTMDRTRYLGYMCVAVLKTNQNGNPGNTWEVITRGTQMPSGVYFSIDESTDASKAVGVGEPGSMSIKLPGSNTAKQCYYFEFNAEGVCVDADRPAQDPGGAVILIGGTRPRHERDPLMLKNNKVGFVVWRNGRTSLYRSPEQIDKEQ
ncbi:MAG: type II secretion system protein [Roseibacillus sp.]